MAWSFSTALTEAGSSTAATYPSPSFLTKSPPSDQSMVENHQVR